MANVAMELPERDTNHLGALLLPMVNSSTTCLFWSYDSFGSYLFWIHRHQYLHHPYLHTYLINIYTLSYYIKCPYLDVDLYQSQNLLSLRSLRWLGSAQDGARERGVALHPGAVARQPAQGALAPRALGMLGNWSIKNEKLGKARMKPEDFWWFIGFIYNSSYSSMVLGMVYDCFNHMNRMKTWIEYDKIW